MIGINCNNYQLRFKIIGKIPIIGRIRERERESNSDGIYK